MTGPSDDGGFDELREFCPQPSLQLSHQSLKLLDPLRLLPDYSGLGSHQRKQPFPRRLLPRHPTIVHTRRSKSRTDTPTTIKSYVNAYLGHEKCWAWFPRLAG